MIRYLNFIEGTSTSGFLEVTEVETLPYAPLSHPLVIRFIGTIRQEYLNHGPFWNAVLPVYSSGLILLPFLRALG